jgi:hypothetical protein
MDAPWLAVGSQAVRIRCDAKLYAKAWNCIVRRFVCRRRVATPAICAQPVGRICIYGVLDLAVGHDVDHAGFRGNPSWLEKQIPVVAPAL